MLQSINPYNNKLIKEYSALNEDRILEKIQKSDSAFKKWKTTSFKTRGSVLLNLALNLKNNIDEYAELMTLEMGKPISESRTEIEKCVWLCNYYVENGKNFLNPTVVKTDATKSFVSYEPIGAILAIMPWNFPFWQVFRFAVPSLFAGNVGILKHSSNVSGCALAIEKIFCDSGCPEGVFQTFLIGSDKVSSIIENPYVKAVTLTGSTSAGKAVAAKAGEMLKKTVLELGGSDPYIILKNANIIDTAKSCSISRLINTGQSCIAAKRFVVVKEIAEEFTKELISNMKDVKMGDPLLDETTIGPMARPDLRDELHQQVENSIKLGAKLILGGSIPKGSGAFYPPTILTNVKPGMPAFDEELFGPVAAIIIAQDETEAIDIANNSVFGLGAAVFTSDKRRGEQIAQKELEAGNCFVNDFIRSDPRLPFGGVKQSGYGRELSDFGIREFVNIKTVYIK